MWKKLYIKHHYKRQNGMHTWGTSVNFWLQQSHVENITVVGALYICVCIVYQLKSIIVVN